MTAETIDPDAFGGHRPPLQKNPYPCGSSSRHLPFRVMQTAAAIDPNITMRDLLVQFPGAQRALFRKYHIGGCSSCGFSPDETLAEVCARNENLNVDEAIEHIVTSEEAEHAMQIEPREVAERITRGEKVYLLDVRTREEYDAVKIDQAHLFTQELMQKIQSSWSRENLLVI